MKRRSRHLGKITSQHSHPQFHLPLLVSLASYGRGGTWRQKWERLKITGGQGSHNKLIGCSASGAYNLGGGGGGGGGRRGEEEEKGGRRIGGKGGRRRGRGRRTEDGITGVIIWRKSTVNS
jgi:hypothetical protein